MLKSFNKLLLLSMLGLLTVGCVVYVPQPQPAPIADEPVITGPGVEVIDVEPAPEDRVYVYDPGFPPGVYFYDNYYWYGGYRYPHDVFINQYVAVNVREHRYFDVDENRRMGQRIEVEHRRDFAANHGVRKGHGPAIHGDGDKRERE